jgi:hypothetical protein
VETGTKAKTDADAALATSTAALTSAKTAFEKAEADLSNAQKALITLYTSTAPNTA